MRLIAHNANLPFVLVKDGYTEKNESEIKHDVLITNFINFNKVIEKFMISLDCFHSFGNILLYYVYNARAYWHAMLTASGMKFDSLEHYLT